MRTSSSRRPGKPIKALIRGNWQILVFSGLFLLGVQVGTMFLGQTSSDTIQSFAAICERFVAARSALSFQEAFLGALGPSLLLCVVILLLGFSAIAQPVLMVIPFFYGSGIGFMASYLYAYSNGQNILLALLVLVPAAVVSGFAIILASRSAIMLSIRFFSKISSQNTVDLRPVIQRYLLQFLVYAVLLLIAALLNSLASYLIFHVFGK